MRFEEWQKLAMGMRTVYTQANFLPNTDAVKIWYKLLQDIPYDVMSIAIQQYMMTNKFPPTVADLRELSVNLTQGKPKDYGDGWQQVLNAIRDYGYCREIEALGSMDDITRQVVKRLGWAQLCMSENIMTDRANFRMIYEQIAERRKQEAQIPYSIKEKAQGLLEAQSVPEITERLVN